MKQLQREQQTLRFPNMYSHGLYFQQPSAISEVTYATHIEDTAALVVCPFGWQQYTYPLTINFVVINNIQYYDSICILVLEALATTLMLN